MNTGRIFPDTVSPEARHRRAIALLFVTALLWSLGGLLIKLVPWPPLAIAGGRGFVAAAVLALVIRPGRLSFSWASLATALSYAGCTVTFVAATKLTTAANAILLQHTCPIWVALLGVWLLRERATRADWVAIVATMAGIVLFFADEFRADLFLGNIVAIISGVFFALTAIFMRRQKDSSPAEALILGNLIGGFVGLPALIGAPFADTTTAGWGAFAALGTVQLALSYFIYARAIRDVTALEAVLIPVIEPILNPLWVMLAIGERPAPWAIAGGLIVLAASVFRAWVALLRQPPVAGVSGADNRELVVVLHGVAVTHRWMRRVARGLEAAGYRVVNRTYPSRTLSIERLGGEWLPRLLREEGAADAPRVHFVAHSMGGIVVRFWLRGCGDAPPPNLGKIVMIAPPNHGSEVPDRLRGLALFRRVIGINGARLGTGGDSVARELSRDAFPAGVAVGVIAGNRSVNPLFSSWIEGENDGTVSVASTRLAGMRDHIVMPHSHSGILLRESVVGQTVHFLREGKFAR